MTRDKINKLHQEIKTYLSSDSPEELLLFLLGKIKGNRDYKVREVGLSNKEDIEKLKDMLKKFSNTVKGFLDKESTFNDIESAGDKDDLLYKKNGNW